MKLQVHDLTFIAEALGKRRPVPVRYLDVLSRHPSEIVREGVVYGLSRDVVRGRAVLERMATSDADKTIRDIAAEALED